MVDFDHQAEVFRYSDTGGDGPVVMLLGGVLTGADLWDDVIAHLRPSYRRIVPELPFGCHQVAAPADIVLTISSMAELLNDFIAELGLRDVTVVSVDWGGAQLLIEPGGADRITRIALVACEAFDNYPPGLPGKILRAHRHPPGGMWVVAQLLRLRLTRNLPFTFGNMSYRATDEQLDRWFEPLVRDRAIRHDLRRYLKSPLSKAQLLEWAERQRRFTGDVLIVWARNDTLMPAEHAERLADHFANTTLRWVDDSRTLVPVDQPDTLAAHLLEFLDATAPSR